MVPHALLHLKRSLNYSEEAVKGYKDFQKFLLKDISNIDNNIVDNFKNYSFSKDEPFVSIFPETFKWMQENPKDAREMLKHPIKEKKSEYTGNVRKVFDTDEKGYAKNSDFGEWCKTLFSKNIFDTNKINAPFYASGGTELMKKGERPYAFASNKGIVDKFKNLAAYYYEIPPYLKRFKKGNMSPYLSFIAAVVGHLVFDNRYFWKEGLFDNATNSSKQDKYKKKNLFKYLGESIKIEEILNPTKSEGASSSFGRGKSNSLKKLCKKLGVRLTVKRKGKRVYKSEAMLKKQCKTAMKRKAPKRKGRFGDKKDTKYDSKIKDAKTYLKYIVPYALINLSENLKDVDKRSEVINDRIQNRLLLNLIKSFLNELANIEGNKDKVIKIFNNITDFSDSKPFIHLFKKTFIKLHELANNQNFIKFLNKPGKTERKFTKNGPFEKTFVFVREKCFKEENPFNEFSRKDNSISAASGKIQQFANFINKNNSKAIPKFIMSPSVHYYEIPYYLRILSKNRELSPYLAFISFIVGIFLSNDKALLNRGVFHGNEKTTSIIYPNLHRKFKESINIKILQEENPGAISPKKEEPTEEESLIFGKTISLKKMCKKLGVRLTVKRGGKRVYKSVKVLKKQCKTAMKRKASKRKGRKGRFGLTAIKEKAKAGINAVADAGGKAKTMFIEAGGAQILPLLKTFVDFKEAKKNLNAEQQKIADGIEKSMQDDLEKGDVDFKDTIAYFKKTAVDKGTQLKEAFYGILKEKKFINKLRKSGKKH